MFTWIKRLFLLAVFLGLIALNILTLVSSAVFNTLSGVVERVARIDTPSSRLKREQATIDNKKLKQKAAAQGLKTNTLRRTKRLVAYQAVEISSSALPAIGTAVVIGGTIWELTQLCESLNEMNTFVAEFEIPESEEEKSILDSVCNPQFPDFDTSIAWENMSVEGILDKFQFRDSEELSAEIPSIEELQKEGSESSYFETAQNTFSYYWAKMPSYTEGSGVDSTNTKEDEIRNTTKMQNYWKSLFNENP